MQQISSVKLNAIIYNTLLIRRDVKKYFKIPLILCLISPLALNPDFPGHLRDIGLLEWRLYNLLDFSDLLINGFLKSFEQLWTDFDVPHKDFYKLF